ncbi:MAG: hypothetical protein O3B82_04945 [Bacteroidetes bacterium]|nr:hypothetical protein [Bacteroidota bacterium]
MLLVALSIEFSKDSGQQFAILAGVCIQANAFARVYDMVMSRYAHQMKVDFNGNSVYRLTP